MPSRIRTEGASKKRVPEGTWQQCQQCGAALYARELERDQMVCSKC
ncbi:MAG: acetyl-CoA carboxylase carboxyl transferase subunit beta, partial [Pseudomonadota bacterium]